MIIVTIDAICALIVAHSPISSLLCMHCIAFKNIHSMPAITTKKIPNIKYLTDGLIFKISKTVGIFVVVVVVVVVVVSELSELFIIFYLLESY